MLMSGANEAKLYFWTVRLVSGKNDEYVSEILEYFGTQQEAQNYVNSMPKYRLTIAYELLNVAVKLI
jgi:hypothetical protein